MDICESLRQHRDIVELFAAEKLKNGFLAVGAPMVRYSKLEFRKLIRQHAVKLCFTPMIIADSFNKSEAARQNEFTTCQGDQALIAQFAAKSIDEFITAAQLVYPYVDGVDVNCGCPQSWAIAKGYGCDLLKNPQMMYDIVRTIRRTLPQDFSCSFKIRLLSEDMRTTVELARQLEHCGATFISIHGRTQWQKCSHPLNVSALPEIKKSVSIPIIVNGDVRSRVDACKLLRETLADGVMSARGLLANPALFDSNFDSEQGTPLQCVQNWLNIAAESGNRITFQCFHHHLTFMWGKQMKRPMRSKFNNYTLKEEVFDFFDEYYGLRPQANLNMSVPNTSCTYTHLKPQEMSNYHNDITNQEWRPENIGKFFLDFNKEAISHSNEINLEDCYFLNS